MNKQTSWLLSFQLCEPEPKSVFIYVKLTLEIKQLFYQQKWVNSRTPEKCNSGQASHGKNPRQVQQIKEGNVTL